MFNVNLDFGNVVIPQDVNRDDYVRFANRTQTACVLTKDGSFYKNCPAVMSFCGINDGFYNSLDFPKTSYELGTPVVLLRMQGSGNCIIIGCTRFNDSDFSVEQEHSFKLVRNSENGSVQIHGKALDGILDLIVHGDNEDGGKINLIAKNNSQSGEFNFATNYFNIEADEMKVNITKMISIVVSDAVMDKKVTSLTYTKGEGFAYKDEFGNFINIQDGFFEADAKKMYLGSKSEASHPIAYGDSTVDIIGQLCDALAAATVTTALGPMPLLNLAQYPLIKQAAEVIKSKSNFTK